MKEELTYKLISKLKPKDKDFEIRDTKVPGLVLRVRKSGNMTYALIYARGRRLTIGSADKIDHDKAREIARGMLAEHFAGQDPIAKRKKIQTDNYLQFLNEVYRPWLESESNLRTRHKIFACLNRCFPELHKLRLDEIIPLVIKKWRQRRIKEIKPASINKQLADLKACLSRAVEWELLKEHPLKKVKPEKLDSQAKVRYLSEDEEQALRKALDDRDEAIKAGRDGGNEWREKRGYKQYGDLRKQAFADHLKPAVLLSLNTGMRRGELLKTKWEDVNFEQKILTIPAAIAKGAKTRHIPLNNEALSVLKAWKKQQKVASIAGYVFSDIDGQPFHDVRSSWANVLDKAEITNFRWHDMRHHFASRLVMRGVDLNTVRELLGHSSYSMTLRYSHLAPEHKAAAVAKLIGAH